MKKRKRAKSESFRVQKKGNVLKFADRDKLDRFLESIDDGDLFVTIEELHSRTKHQNNYYWKGIIGRPGVEGCLLDSESFGGYTPLEMHQALKVLFKIESTSKLSVDEFTDYINDIIVTTIITKF